MKQRFHWHAGCKNCRQLIYVAAANGSDAPILPTTPIHALCPYCIQAFQYDPELLVLHTGYGTIYKPPQRNLSDTVVLVAGIMAAIKLARVEDFKVNDVRLRVAFSMSMKVAEDIVSRLVEREV